MPPSGRRPSSSATSRATERTRRPRSLPPFQERDRQPHHEIRSRQSLSLRPHPGVRAQRRVDLAPAGRAGRPAHPAAGRQRGRRRDRHGGRHDAGRAGQQRPGQRCLRDPLGRRATPWPQCLGSGAPGLDARVLPQEVWRWRPGAPDARHRLGHRAGRRARLGRPEQALRQAAIRRPVRTRHRHRRARLPGATGGAAEVGRRHADPAGAAGLRPGLPALGPGARGGRAVPLRRRRAGAAGHRADRGRGLLQRRDRPRAGEVLRRAGRRAHGRGPGGLPAGMGDADLARLSWPHAARDPAQRPGHRRADRAGHPGEVRHGVAAGRLGRVAAPADRGHEAGLRRCLPLCVGAIVDDADPRANAR